MDWSTIARNWKNLRGNFQENWDELTNDDLDIIAGNRDQLIGKLEDRYGISREEAEKQIDDFVHDFSNEVYNPNDLPGMDDDDYLS